MKVALAYDDRFLQHIVAQGHPESSSRLNACVAGLKESGLWHDLSIYPATTAITPEAVHRVHEINYLDKLRGLIGSDPTRTDPSYLTADTCFGPETWNAAIYAAGSTLDLAQRIFRGEHQRGFSLVRPPGHHALYAYPEGFCFLGNVAIAAAWLRDQGQRVAIIDVDVHHGNGTQDAFYRDPQVLFISLHRYGSFYPGSGAANETGVGKGQGTTLNIPLTARTDHHEYLAALDNQVFPLLENFQPQALLVSAGFDTHRQDPLGGIDIDSDTHAAIAARIQKWADQFCRGAWLAVLEGGYHLPSLALGVCHFIREMAK